MVVYVNFTTNVSTEETDSELIYISKAIMFYGLSIIIPFGLIFNTLSIIVFMSRPLRKRSASWYLAALGVSDDISLVTVMFDYWMKDERIGMPVTQHSDVMCVLVTYMSYFSRLFSSVIITSFTVERFIGVVFPLKRATLRTTAHVRKLLLVEAPLCLLATSFTVFTIGIVEYDDLGTQCDIRAEMAVIYGIFNVVILIFGSIVIPIIVICSLNIFMFRQIWLRKKNFPTQDMTFSGNKPVSKRRRSHYNTATLLLAVSTVFVILNTPYCITWILLFCHYYKLLPLGEGMFQHLYAAKYITSVQYYLNYGSNILVYNLCAKMFRVEFFNTCCILCRLFDLRSEMRNESGMKPTYDIEFSTRSLERNIANGLCPTVKTLSRHACGYHCRVRSDPTPSSSVAV